MDADEVRVELVVPEAIAGAAEQGACEALLAPEERERAARMRVPAARLRFVVAQALARRALSRAATGVAPEAWRFRRGPQGKPEIAGPGAGAGLRFNLSHTEGLAACAVSRDLDVGIDVEAGAHLGEPLPLAARFFSPDEARWLCALPEDERRGRFLDLWSLKEAVLKGLGSGLAGGLASVRFALADGVPRLCALRAQDGEPVEWQIALLRPTPRHRLALAIRRGTRPDLRLTLRAPEGGLSGLG